MRSFFDVFVAIVVFSGCQGTQVHNHDHGAKPILPDILKTSSNPVTLKESFIQQEDGQLSENRIEGNVPFIPEEVPPFDRPGTPTEQDLEAVTEYDVPLCTSSCLGYNVNIFHTVVTCGCIRVTVIASNVQKIEVKGPQPNLIRELQTFVQDGVLYVQPKNMSFMLDMLDITVHINRTDFGNVKIFAGTASAVVVKAPQNIAGQWNLILGIHPGSSISANVTVQTLYSNVFKTGGYYMLTGRVNKHFIFVRGTATVSAMGLVTLLTDIDSVGSGIFYVHARQRISGTTHGAALVYYDRRYNPIVTVDGSGFQTVKRF